MTTQITLLLLSLSAAPPPAAPALEPIIHADYEFRGPVGDRLAANTRSWLLTTPAANPSLLQMFRDRDRTPPRDLVPWAGEFAGKYLLSAVLSLRLHRDRELETHVRRFVADLIATQADDGYFGPFPKDRRLTGKGLWDLWGQYHVMLGLLRWHELTADPAALAACRRGADLFCRHFLDGRTRVLHAGSEEMNQSCAHVLVLLHRLTGEPRYLNLVREVEKDWETPPSGDYVRTALAGLPFHKTPKPRWESLHAIQAVAELHLLTGDERYKKALDQIWWSIVEGDRHNSGGFSSGEQATGNPYDPKPIETCCTIAWAALTVDRLRLTGDARAADELELSFWNGVLGSQHPSGRWWTYNTPMDGERKASAHDIVFQARAGSPELNCCSVNGPRGLAGLADWAVMAAPDGLALNYYGPCRLTVPLPSGRKVRLEQATDYPVGDRVRLAVSPESEERFALRLRIPGWSRTTRVAVNGADQSDVRPGSYLKLDRTWKAGDEVTLAFDFAPRLWVGERESAGKASVYRGPLLLAYDPRFDTHDPGRLPPLAVKRLGPWEKVDLPVTDPRPLLLIRAATADGRTLTVCDFASAGTAGNRYVSWLPVPGLRPTAFSRENPLRAVWP